MASFPKAHETEAAIDAAKRALDEWRDAACGKTQRTLPMPWVGIETTTGGWPLGKLVFVGGRSSEHKTTVLREAAVCCASHGHRSVFWTLEDGNEDIAARTISNAVRMTTRDLGSGSLDGRKIEEAQASALHKRALGIIATAPWRDHLRLIDAPAPTLSNLLEVMGKEADLGAKLFCIDYFQLVLPDRGEPNASFTRTASAALATFAKQRKVCVIASSQIDKAGTLESENDCRVPKAAEMLFGTVLRQVAHGVLMVGLTGSSQLTVFVDKWKNAPRGAYSILGVDPAYDRLDEVV